MTVLPGPIGFKMRITRVPNPKLIPLAANKKLMHNLIVFTRRLKKLNLVVKVVFDVSDDGLKPLSLTAKKERICFQINFNNSYKASEIFGKSNAAFWENKIRRMVNYEKRNILDSLDSPF